MAVDNTKITPGIDELDLNLSDEIVVKDKDGTFKVLIDGKLHPLVSENIGQTKIGEAPEQLFQTQGLVSEEPTAERLAPPPLAPWQKQEGASFYFHPEDEEEVREIAEQKGIMSGEENIDAAVKDILDVAGIEFAEPMLDKRAASIIGSRLKHIRERSEVRNLFLKSIKTGGLEMSETDTERLIAVIEEQLKSMEAEEKMPPEKTELDKIIDQAEDMYDVKQAVSEYDASEADYNDVVEASVLAQSPGMSSIPEAPPEPVPDTDQTEAEIPSFMDTPVVSPQMKRSIMDSSRPRVDDVKPMTKLRGPIDELRFMNVTELRRLGGDATSNINRIKDKIESLEEESFVKKVEGIKAWRQSDLYSMYVDVGKSSMEQGKPISQIISESEQRGDSVLTLAEFEAITDLNQQLRF